MTATCGPVRHDSSMRISKLSMSGFASSSSHMRWISAARAVVVVRLDLEVDDATDARGGDVEAELRERMPNSVALRVEDAFLRSDENGRLHSTTPGRATYPRTRPR